MGQKKLISIVGPTAVGKTSLAIELAKRYNTVILSTDSRQFYVEMNIGTAKPDAEELKQAKHYFINSHTLDVAYSAGDYEVDALRLLRELYLEYDVVFAVGGSGLFVRALTEGLDQLPKAPEGIRSKWNRIFEERGIKALQERLKEVDPLGFSKIDQYNPQRMIRSIEVFEATGKPMSSYQTEQPTERFFEVYTVGLNIERENLYQRINQRVESMFALGLLEEVKGLASHRDHPALKTVGYSEIFEFLDGKCSLEDAKNRIQQNSRRYAKRQITWFKKYGNTHWFNATEIDEICQQIEKFIGA